MPRKPIELPPEVARAFLDDVRDFLAAGHNTIQDGCLLDLRGGFRI